MTFSEKLLKKRRQLGLSQEELAGKLEVSRQAVSRWELGTAMPDAPKLLALSDLFGVPVDALLRDEMEMDPPAQPDLPVQTRQGDGGKWWNIAGVIISVLAVVGLLTLMICSSVERVTFAPAYEIGADGIERMASPGYGGMKAFLHLYDLEWLLYLCIGCIPGGVLVALLPAIAKKMRSMFS